MLKATGIVRPVDELGRVVLPIALRRERGIAPNDELEIYVEGENIILQKYKPRCVFCGENEELVEFKGKLVCRGCCVGVRRPFGHAADGVRWSPNCSWADQLHGR